MEVKQCKKCVQCFQNLTNNSSKNLVPILINETETNKTTNITNSLNKIILCKSKAAFFKRIYKAVQNSGMNASSSIRNVGKIQINGYSIKEFHKKCDGVAGTVVLVQTEYNKIIGGYTPIAWSSAKKQWAADKTQKSFIFSLNMR